MFSVRVLLSSVGRGSIRIYSVPEVTQSLFCITSTLLSRKSTTSSTCVVISENKNQEIDYAATNTDNPNSATKEDRNAKVDNVSNISETPRKKTKRYALLLCFLGANYYGMQFQPKFPTIEAEFFKAIFQAGYINEEQLNNPRFSLGYNRASRTDCRVSALRQVISLKLDEEPTAEKINELLPSDIRVLGTKLTTKSFDSRKFCSSRSYIYTLPTFALCRKVNLPEQWKSYRINAYNLNKANEIFQEFKGTHSFHNYTEKRDHWDPRSKRRIWDASVSDAYLVGDMEFVDLHITGASFMLHQIRRMVGMLISIMRGELEYSGLRDSLELPIMPSPTAPSLGLMLEKQHFTKYNRIFGSMRPPLVWDEYDEEVEKFKIKYIVPYIVRSEQFENIYENFLNDQLIRHSFKPNQNSSKIALLHAMDMDPSKESTEVSKDTDADSYQFTLNSVV